MTKCTFKTSNGHRYDDQTFFSNTNYKGTKVWRNSFKGLFLELCLHIMGGHTLITVDSFRNKASGRMKHGALSIRCHQTQKTSLLTPSSSCNNKSIKERKTGYPLSSLPHHSLQPQRKAKMYLFHPLFPWQPDCASHSCWLRVTGTQCRGWCSAVMGWPVNQSCTDESRSPFWLWRMTRQSLLCCLQLKRQPPPQKSCKKIYIFSTAIVEGFFFLTQTCFPYYVKQEKRKDQRLPTMLCAVS